MVTRTNIVTPVTAIIMTLALAVSVLADTPFALSEKIHQLVESGDFETALTKGIEAVTQHPEDPELLHEVGRAAFRSNRYHVAIYYFNRALHFRPHYSASLLYLGWAQKRADLLSEARQTFQHLRVSDDNSHQRGRVAAIEALKQLGPEPPLRAPAGSHGVASRGFCVVAPYAALLEYGGTTQKFSGETYQLDLRAGLLGLGYIELAEAWTSIQTLPGYPEYEVFEHRMGLGGFVAPNWLLKGKYAYLDADYDGGGTGHFSALGIDWQRPGRLRGGLTASYSDYPNGDISMLMPRMTWRGERFELTTTVSVQQWAPTNGTDKIHAMIRQDLLISLARGDGISIGYAAGESRYGHAGFGDVLYTLPDKQTGSFYLRYSRPLYPFMLSWKAGIDTYKTEEGDRYQATAHTLSLGYLSRNARAPLAPRPSTWTLAFGASTRKSSAQLTMEAADPLVATVSGPIAFSDETGDYVNIYTYGLESGLNPRELDTDNRAVSPYAELRRRTGVPGARHRFSFYGRYTFVPHAYEFESESAGYQRIWESVVNYYTSTPFGAGRSLYTTYNAAQQGRFDLNLHELALGAESEVELLSCLQLAVSGGLLLGVADWSASDSTQWTESDDSTLLLWADRQDSGQEFLVGATADLRLRWAPSTHSPWFIEAGGGYVWYEDLNINGSPIAATFDLTSITATLGIGLR